MCPLIFGSLFMSRDVQSLQYHLCLARDFSLAFMRHPNQMSETFNRKEQQVYSELLVDVRSMRLGPSSKAQLLVPMIFFSYCHMTIGE